jgi:hypothetical protein
MMEAGIVVNEGAGVAGTGLNVTPPSTGEGEGVTRIEGKMLAVGAAGDGTTAVAEGVLEGERVVVGEFVVTGDVVVETTGDGATGFADKEVVGKLVVGAMVGSVAEKLGASSTAVGHSVFGALLGDSVLGPLVSSVGAKTGFSPLSVGTKTGSPPTSGGSVFSVGTR